MSTPQNPNDADNGQDQLQPQDPNRPQSQGPHEQNRLNDEDLQAEQRQPRANDQSNDPGQAQPSYEQPSYEQPSYEQPSYEQPSYDQSGYQQGSYDQQTYQQAAYQQGNGTSHAYAQQGAYGYPEASAPQGSAHPQTASYPQSAGYVHSPQPGSSEPGFFKSLFDIRFDNFIAVKWAGLIYIIAIIVAALSYLGTIVAGITTGVAAGSAASYFNDGPSFTVLPLILSIIFGWIIPVLWVIAVRLVLELIVSNIKTAEHTRRIADSIGR